MEGSENWPLLPFRDSRSCQPHTAVMCSYHSRGAWSGGPSREGSWCAAEKALLGENDRPVPKTQLYTKQFKDWTSFITGQHESCITHTGNWPLVPPLCVALSPTLTAFCLNWRITRKEGWCEGGRDQKKEEQKRLQCYSWSNLIVYLTNRRIGEKHRSKRE